jgi:hypothetical protein
MTPDETLFVFHCKGFCIIGANIPFSFSGMNIAILPLAEKLFQNFPP